MKVSAIIPAYNIENWIPDLIRCVLKQTLKDFELIIVDDGSTDGTLETVLSFDDKRIKVIHTENEGVSCARNTGISNAQGEYLAFLDGDDLIDDRYFEILLSAAEKTGADIVKCSYSEFEDGKDISGVSHPIEQDMVEFFPGMFHCFHYTVWATLYRRQFLEKNSVAFIPGENYAEDAPFCMLTNSIGKLEKIDEVLYFHRIRESSAVARIQKGELKPLPPITGLERAIDIFREKESNPIRNEFFDFCVFRNLASFLTTQYMFKPYDGEFRRKLCLLCAGVMDGYYSDVGKNSYVSGDGARNIKNHPFSVRLAVKLFVKAYRHDRLYAFSSLSARILRMLGRTKA